MLQFFPFILLFIILFIYIKNKNKQASPKLLETRTKLYKELTVNCSVDKAYRAILQFGQSSDYKIDYTDNAKHQLILNYIPKMGEQTNGTFFPIWIEALNERTSKVYVGSKDKSLAMAFEEKKALNKIIPLLEAALYSIQPSNHEYSEIDKQEALDSSINKVGQKEKSFIGERIISNDKYKLFLIDKYNIKKNDVLNQYVCDEKLFTSVDEALSHGASIEELKIKEITANELLLTHKEQEHIAALALLEKKSKNAMLRPPKVFESKRKKPKISNYKNKLCGRLALRKGAKLLPPSQFYLLRLQY